MAELIVFSEYSLPMRRWQSGNQCLDSVVFLLQQTTENPQKSRRRRVKLALGAGKQQRIQHSNRLSRLYSKIIGLIDF